MTIHSDEKKVTYRVGGLKGDHCRDRVQHAISHLDGVTSVEVDVKNSTVSVVFHSNDIADGYIQETLQSLGYSPIGK